jgi:alkaline phosphatase
MPEEASMKISAWVQNSKGENTVMLRTGDHAHGLRIAPRASGSGSSVSGGELLFLALAT